MKWKKEQQNLVVGDMVLMKDEQAHRKNWPLGKVDDAVRGKDGRVRKVTVLTSKDGQRKMYKRPLSTPVRLVPMEDVSMH